MVDDIVEPSRPIAAGATKIVIIQKTLPATARGSGPEKWL